MVGRVVTRQEAENLFWSAKWVLSDMGYGCSVAGLAEDLELRIAHLDASDRRSLADLVLPPGRAGRCKLVLYPPEEARAFAFFRAVLLSVKDE